MDAESPALLWTPGPERVAQARVTRFMQWLRENNRASAQDYAALWQWSVTDLEGFYGAVWDYFDFPHSAPPAQVLSTRKMPGARWFAGAQLNFAQQMFRQHPDDPDHPAILARSEVRDLQTLTWGQLRAQVASVARHLREMGVTRGDRVVSYMPNIPETMVAFFAVCSLGAIWSSCSPDMGARSVLDRFRQIDPKVVFAADGYRYGGKDFSRLDVIATLREELPTLEHVVLLRYLDRAAAVDGAVCWSDIAHTPTTMTFEQVPFDHPLWVVYSSGTTGLPKPIVHSHGGALVKGTQDTAFQFDLGPQDRFMWFTTTGWIMWNLQMFGLLVGATICLYDGSPGHPDLDVLWRFADEAELTFFGAGAAYYLGCRKAGVAPGRWMRSRTLKTVGSTGSPLSEEGYRWIMAQFPDVMVGSTSGGTDVAAGYVGCCPTLPVYAGEMQCRNLGVAVYAYSDAGQPVDDEVGELVVTEPMPSMPLYFWNDEDGSRLHDSYFSTFPGVWRHGDWIRITPRGGAVIYGRSDTTINRHGVRMGTAEIYSVVDDFPEIQDSLVVDLEYLGRDSS
ncbi:MAG: acetoacetate--CoA ligase [Ottowia sp.]|nr:acetoacetate--CoA ligase [Ottowia sp.]